jgi:hypothetical protein
MGRDDLNKMTGEVEAADAGLSIIGKVGLSNTYITYFFPIHRTLLLAVTIPTLIRSPSNSLVVHSNERLHS